MHEQNQIGSTLASADGTARLKDLLAQAGSVSRTEVGRRVCELFGFHDALGRPQLAGCMKALRRLEADRRIELPAPRHARRRCRPRRLGRPVPQPAGVPERVDLVQALAVVEVTGDDQRRLWNELVASEHPRGAAHHVGAQLRYLLVSEHGVLGALGFAASALALAARDAFIGWDAELRSRQLHRVLALSRFLIRPSVRCQNLASKALGLCLRQIQCLGRRAGRRIVQGAGVVWTGDNAPSGQGGSARWGGQRSSCAGGWQLHGARQAWRGPGRPAGQRVGGAGGSAEEQGDGLVRVQAQLRHAPFDIRRFQQP